MHFATRVSSGGLQPKWLRSKINVDAMSSAPLDTMKLLEDVNAFRGGTERNTVEDGPMICSSKISLTDDELQFLNKGY